MSEPYLRTRLFYRKISQRGFFVRWNGYVSGRLNPYFSGHKLAQVLYGKNSTNGITQATEHLSVSDLTKTDRSWGPWREKSPFNIRKLALKRGLKAASEVKKCALGVDKAGDRPQREAPNRRHHRTTGVLQPRGPKRRRRLATEWINSSRWCWELNAPLPTPPS